MCVISTVCLAEENGAPARFVQPPDTGKIAAVATLVALGRVSDSALLELITSDHQATRQYAIGGTPAKRLAAFLGEARLAELAEAPRPSPALRALATIPPTDVSIPTLLRMARLGDKNARAWAILAIGAAGPAAKPHANALVDAVERLPDNRISDCFVALGRVGGAECVQALERALKTKPRVSVLSALALASPENEALRATARAWHFEPSARFGNRPTVKNARGAAVSLQAGFDERAAIATLSNSLDHHDLWRFRELWATKGLAERLVRNGLYAGVSARGLGKLLTRLSNSEQAKAKVLLVAEIENTPATWQRNGQATTVLEHLTANPDPGAMADDVSIPQLIGWLDTSDRSKNGPPPRSVTLRLIAERGSAHADHARSLVSRYMKTKRRDSEELDAAFRRALARLDPDGKVTRETVREMLAFFWRR